MKKANFLYLCEVRISGVSEDYAFEALSAYIEGFIIKRRPQSRSFILRRYFDSLSEAEKFRKEVLSRRKELSAQGITICSSRRNKLLNEDWSEKWKRYFKIIRVGEKLVIKPTWLKYKVKNGDIIIEIDPGMSFGTGRHETTKFCLEMLEKYRFEKPQSFLDIGCGSGILTIAAAKLGYKPILAFDNDPEAVVVSGENLGRNGVAKFAKLSCMDIEKKLELGYFDLVVANLISDLLIKVSGNISSAVAQDGILILAGILESQADDVLKAFNGFALLDKKTESGWTGMVLQHNKKSRD